MVESPSSQRLFGRVTYAALVLAILFVQLLPMQTVPQTIPAPDVILVLTLTWAARRPDMVPAILIAAACLLADVLLMRPPGLWAGLVLLTTELLRVRSATLRRLPFMLEWLTAALAIVAITLGYRAVIALFMQPQTPLLPTLFQMVLSILAYPPVVAVSHWFLGVRRAAQGEVDAFGRPV